MPVLSATHAAIFESPSLPTSSFPPAAGTPPDNSVLTAVGFSWRKRASRIADRCLDTINVYLLNNACGFQPTIRRLSRQVSLAALIYSSGQWVGERMTPHLVRFPGQVFS